MKRVIVCVGVFVGIMFIVAGFGTLNAQQVKKYQTQSGDENGVRLDVIR